MSSPIPGSKRKPRANPRSPFEVTLPVEPPHGDPRKGKFSKDKPYKMPQILPNKPGAKKPTLSLGVGNMSKYRPIKNTKQVNKTYNTY